SYTMGGVQVQVPGWGSATCALERGGRYSIFARAGTTPPQKWQWIVRTSTSHKSRARAGAGIAFTFVLGLGNTMPPTRAFTTSWPGRNAQRPGERSSPGRRPAIAAVGLEPTTRGL